MGLWKQSGKSADEWSETTGSRPREGTPEALVFADTALSVFRKPGSALKTSLKLTTLSRLSSKKNGLNIAALLVEHCVARIWNRATLSGTRYKHVPVRSAVAVHGDRRSRIGSPDSSCWI